MVSEVYLAQRDRSASFVGSSTSSLGPTITTTTCTTASPTSPTSPPSMGQPSSSALFMTQPFTASTGINSSTTASQTLPLRAPWTPMIRFGRLTSTPTTTTPPIRWPPTTRSAFSVFLRIRSKLPLLPPPFLPSAQEPVYTAPYLSSNFASFNRLPSGTLHVASPISS